MVINDQMSEEKMDRTARLWHETVATLVLGGMLAAACSFESGGKRVVSGTDDDDPAGETTPVKTNPSTTKTPPANTSPAPAASFTFAPQPAVSSSPLPSPAVSKLPFPTPSNSPTPAGGGSATKVTFSKDIGPLLNSKCGGCHYHGGKLTYTWAKNNAAHNWFTGGHAGASWSSTEKSKITQWISDGKPQ
jgi:hypothetical protein